MHAICIGLEEIGIVQLCYMNRLPAMKISIQNDVFTQAQTWTTKNFGRKMIMVIGRGIEEVQLEVEKNTYGEEEKYNGG